MRRHGPAAVLLPLLGAAAAFGATGCATGDAAALRGDLLSAQDELARVRTDLRDAEADLAAAERAADALRTRLAAAAGGTDTGSAGGVIVAGAEQVRAMGRVSQVVVAKLLTGGLDRDGLPGEEVLAVTLAPADADGAPVKAPGAVRLELVDLTAGPDRRQVGEWSFDEAEAADAWRSTAVGTGYRFRLPLPARSASQTGLTGGREELHLVVRFETTDGRRFDATHPLLLDRPLAADTPAPLRGGWADGLADPF